MWSAVCKLRLLVASAHAPLPQALGGDSPMPEAARGAADSDDEMGRELFGYDDAEASDGERGVSAEAPASAALAEPPAPPAEVREVPMLWRAGLVGIPLVCFMCLR